MLYEGGLKSNASLSFIPLLRLIMKSDLVYFIPCSFGYLSEKFQFNEAIVPNFRDNWWKKICTARHDAIFENWFHFEFFCWALGDRKWIDHIFIIMFGYPAVVWSLICSNQIKALSTRIFWKRIFKRCKSRKANFCSFLRNGTIF